MKKNRLMLRRKLLNTVATVTSLLAVAFGLFWLFWILWTTFSSGLAGMSLALFTEMTPPPNSETGGLANAIMGSAMMVGLATLIGTPIGIFTGVYLAEYAKRDIFGEVIRFVNDILLSAPSIIIGLFVYEVYVARLGHFAGWAGIMALTLIVIPIMVRATENMLQLVPVSLREAAFALGAPNWHVIVNITLKTSLAGVITGVMLAVARIAGETAPLLFTSLSNQYWSMNLNEPIASLPVVIFKFAMSPFEDWNRLAWAGVFLIVLTVLGLNIAARIITRKRK
jgi:phosphate transport system permease protein